MPTFCCRHLLTVVEEIGLPDMFPTNLSRKLSKYVPILYRIQNLCTPRSLKLIYNCLIYSNLIYCNSVWGYCRSVALNPLIVTHKKIVRALAGVGYNHHTTEIFNDLSFLNIRKINEYMVGIFAYKCLANEEFSTWFDYRTTNYVTRASETNPLNISRITSVHSEQSISYRGGVVWSNISPDIRN